MSMTIKTTAMANSVIHEIVSDLTKRLRNHNVVVYANFSPAVLLKSGAHNLSINIEIADTITDVTDLADDITAYKLAPLALYTEVNALKDVALNIYLCCTEDYIQKIAPGYDTHAMEQPSMPYENAPTQYYADNDFIEALYASPLGDKNMPRTAPATPKRYPEWLPEPQVTPVLTKYNQTVLNLLAKYSTLDYGVNYANRVNIAYRGLIAIRNQALLTESGSLADYDIIKQDPNTQAYTFQYKNHVLLVHPLLVINTSTGYCYADNIATNRKGLNARVAKEYPELVKLMDKMVKQMHIFPLRRTPVLKDTNANKRTLRALQLAGSNGGGKLRFAQDLLYTGKLYNLDLLYANQILPTQVPSNGLTNRDTTFVFVAPSKVFRLIVSPVSIQLFTSYKGTLITERGKAAPKIPQIAVTLATASESGSASAMCKDAVYKLNRLEVGDGVPTADYATAVTCLNYFELAYNLRKKLPPQAMN